MYKDLSLWQKIKLGFLKRLKCLPAPKYLGYYYEYYTGKKYKDHAPTEFNEKIQWYKAHYHNPLLNTLIDKYAVRDYVADKIGSEYLNEVYYIFDHPNQIKFSNLPNSFVLKGVHGYGYNLIVSDKQKLNEVRAKRLLWKWYRRNPYTRGKQWGYRDIPPRFMVEKYLSELNQSSLIDYKFYCFSGEPKFVEIHHDRGASNYMYGFFDLDLKPLPFHDGPVEKKLESTARPINFELMIDLARKLADDLPFVRVDFYNIEGRIIFGEMTFYPAGGTLDFVPDEYNRLIGDLFELPSGRFVV